MVICALAAVALLGVAYVPLRGDYGDVFVLPGSESQRMVDLLKERFPSNSGDQAAVVVAADAGVEDTAVREKVEDLIRQIEGLPDVVAVHSPYAEGGRISQDGRIAIIEVHYSETARNIDVGSVETLVDLRDETSAEGFQVEVGGPLLRRVEQEPPGSAEVIGLGAAAVILLISFGTVVAMGLPIVTALLGLTGAFFIVGIGTSLFTMPTFTPQFAAMIGIGVGIDYALLVVNRFREARAGGMEDEEAIVMAAGTAGRAVLFAGVTVVIALLGLWSAGILAIGYAATAASVGVALAVVVALLVLPALLKLAGIHIDRWRLPGLAAPAVESETGFGYRWSRAVQRYPLLFLAASLAGLLLLAAPAFDMRLGSSDAGNNPESLTSRRAYDLLAEGFGPGFNGPIFVAFQLDGEGVEGPVDAVPAEVAAWDGVATVSNPIYNEGRTAALITVVPASAPQEEETGDLVHRLRDDLSQRFMGTGATPFVGGPTALFIDVGERINSRLPIFFVAVIGLSLLLLTAVFRSFVVAIKAAIMNLLSIGASLGILVAIFQWGWLGGVVGVEREGPIESFLPMMLFAVLFGLSMDYEMFLVSRIREEYLHHGNNSEAVARGLSVTTRVISAAASIMIAVFLSFALSDQRIIKEFGIGLASAIFIDATLVRLMLVPAIMQLMGNWNWWFPSWLDRIVPRLGVERGIAAIGEREPLGGP